MMIRVLCLLALLLSGTVFAQCRHDFSHVTSYELADVSDSFRGAIVNLAIKDESYKYLGTGFLIDEEAGLYITARHVVEDYADESSPLVAVHGESPYYSEVPVSVLRLSSNFDVGLLVVKEDADLPLEFPNMGDLYFRDARHGDDRLYAFGKGPIDGERNLRSARATFLNWTKQRTIMQVETSIVSGDSGGPLVDRYGRVTGIFKAKTGGGVASMGEFTPFVLARDVLLNLGPNPTVTRLNQKLYDGQHNEASLAMALGKLTNVELLMWLNLIAKQSDAYAHVRDLIGCPFYQALVDRKMTDFEAARPLAPLLSQAEAGRLYIDQAAKSAFIGDSDSVREDLGLAIGFLDEAISEAEQKDYKAEYVAYLYMDVANANYKLAGLADGVQRLRYYGTGLSNYLQAAELNPTVSGLALSMSGNTLLRVNEPSLAAKAFIEAEHKAANVGKTLPGWALSGKGLAFTKVKCAGDCQAMLTEVPVRDLKLKAASLSSFEM